MSGQIVLFVDDEISVLRAIKRSFRIEPYEVITANSGKEALEILSHQHVDVVVSDQRMPEMSGTELLEKIKHRWPGIVRVILSGYADAPSIVDAINLSEVYRFLTKPWDDQAIKKALRGCLELAACASGDGERLGEV